MVIRYKKQAQHIADVLGLTVEDDGTSTTDGDKDGN